VVAPGIFRPPVAHLLGGIDDVCGLRTSMARWPGGLIRVGVRLSCAYPCGSRCWSKGRRADEASVAPDPCFESLPSLPRRLPEAGLPHHRDRATNRHEHVTGAVFRDESAMRRTPTAGACSTETHAQAKTVRSEEVFNVNDPH
jgi:hypothetical protein